MILVTGVSGALGGLVHSRLSADTTLEVVAGTRTPSRWAGTGPVRPVDFDEPGGLAAAFDGVDVLVLVSAGYAEDDVVLARHAAAIEAAEKAGVRHVVYTSLAGSGEHLTIALPHRWTEARLAAAPFATTILRNALYAEIPAGLALLAAASAASTGVFRAPFGQGTVPVVAREDLAEAAARVAAETQRALSAGQDGPHAGRCYELEGTAPVGGADIAAALAEALGTAVRYEPSPLGETWAALAGAGQPPYQVAHMVSIFSNINAGMMTPSASDLPALLGTAPRPVSDLLVEAVRAGA
ncbi:NAD(P)H-binding protein [Sphaerisporangium fuscum]|uniref:NAD(P)H-binding protein n=1 Tax=Sphaerisporangium fuscum TaxID=2835868 RepID=UPI001BDCD0D2|nr:NAD(P)H-binding protein [Sphaerisporangium fuscum]